MPATDNSGTTPAVKRFPCAQCGAELHYAPGTATLRCAHCGYENRITPSTAPVRELDFQQVVAELAAHESHRESQQESIINHCDACGAEYTFDPALHADTCPFCGSAAVAGTTRHRHLPVNALLPFAVPAGQARDLFRRWLRRLWFAPGKLKRYGRDDSKLTGMYIPYWTYDAATVTTYEGMRGDYYQVPESYQTVENGRTVIRTRMVTKIRWSSAAGTVARDFDDVLVLAGQTLSRYLAEELEPWDLHHVQPYQDEYLSGFRSEMYRLDPAQGFDRAREIMARTIDMDVARDIGGDQQRIGRLDTRYGHIHCKHILLPIWVSAFRFGNKTYRFLVNGRTGEVQGERPYSPWKITVAIVVGIVVIMVLVWLAGQQGRYAPL
ncbi:MAG: primosomal protein N' (replication factor Y) - superfamily II helicase [Candidatus Competibacteraceae bacterium]